MKYPYPRLTHTLTFRRISGDMIEITDFAEGTQFHFPLPDAWFARQLDGYTDPYSMDDVFTREEIDEQLAYLAKHRLLEGRRVRYAGLGTWMFPLLVPGRSRGLRRLARIYHTVLLLLWLPMLLIGIVLFTKLSWTVSLFTSFFQLYAGLAVGILSGLVLHEVGHACAGMTYGGRVFEMGVLIIYFIAPGAYVLTDDSGIRGRLQRLQLFAAGIESNFLLTGLFLTLAILVPVLGELFMMAAFANLILALSNLMLIRGLDGARILELLLGMNEPFTLAARVVKSRKIRQTLCRGGGRGWALLIMSYMLTPMRIMLPLIYLQAILEIFIH